MKATKYILPLLLFFIAACNNEEKQPAPNSENDLDAARNFVNSALKGDYNKVRTYMLKDSINEEWMKQVERLSVNMPPEEKKGLASASIIIHERKPINDTATIVIYSNSFKNNKDTLKVLKQGNDWLVDFSYLFNHSKDSIWIQPTGNDTIAK
jgi:hypothetical protein